MNDTNEFFQTSVNYRIWVDGAGVGHIRIVKRINFKTLVAIYEKLYVQLKNKNQQKANIILYISKSLYDEMSDNSKEFLEFCRSCIGVKFELYLTS